MVRSTLDAVVAGHLCLDISPDLRGLAEPVQLEEVFAPTRLTSIGQAVLSTGGVVSNTGLALRRLGVRAVLMGKCGADIFGRAVLEMLEREAPGSSAGMALVKNEPTSYTVVLAPPGFDRFFLHCAGTNDTFGFKDLNLATIKRARLFHFGYPTLMKRTLANKGRELIKIFKTVHQLGLTTCLDLSMPDPNSPEGRRDWPKLLERLLPHVDLFVPSVEELMFILARKKFEKLVRRAKGGDLLDELDLDVPMQLAGQCLEMGAKVMLVKCGRLGIYARSGSKSQIEQMGRACPTKKIKDWAQREIFEPSFRVKKIVSALGAGDCAVAGFLAGLLRGVSLADALRYSTAVGAQNVRVLDAVSGTKSWRQTTEQIRRRPAKTPLQLDMSCWRWVRLERHYLGPHDG
ncbi:MAG: carbohydrate kinase family protein, partial [Phycisphaerae bacterium]|nr:carbohydrate kinase family protein [Phycisphaerae bacterium]